MNGDFGVKIKEIIKRFNVSLDRTKNNRYHDHTQFNSQFDQEVSSLIEQIKADVMLCANSSRIPDPVAFEQLLESKLNKALLINGNTRRFQKVKSSVHTYIKSFDDITNEIKQEIKHDYASKRRFLLFRVLTTLGIAGAALSMAMFANFLGYETAILKKIDEKPKTELTTKLPIKTTAKDVKKVIVAVKSG